MKTLFQDKVVDKLKKVPAFCWFLVLAVAEFCASAYVTYTNASLMAGEYVKAFDSAGVAFSPTLFIVVFCIFSPIISAAICELLMRVAYSVIRRFALSVSKEDFCFRVRIVLIVADLILGIIGVVYFFYPIVTDLSISIFECAVPALLLGWFYEDFRVRFVPKQLQAKVFSFVAAVYLVIYFAIGLLNLLYTLVFYLDQLTTISLVAMILDPCVVAILAIGAYFNYRRLKKISSEPDDFIIDKQEEKPKDETIFKDLGF